MCTLRGVPAIACTPLARISSFLPPCRLLELNSDHQTWQQVLYLLNQLASPWDLDNPGWPWAH